MSQFKDQLSLLVSPFPSQHNQKVQRRDLPAWTRTMAVRTSVGKRRRVASPVNVDLDSSSPETWRTANVSRVSHSFPSVKTHTHSHTYMKTHTVRRIYRLLVKRCLGLETCRWRIIALIPQMPSNKAWSRLLALTLHYQAMTNLLSGPHKEKHVYQIRGDHLHNQGKCGGYSKGTALMDSAHFLLLCNGDHPVRAGARADGGFVCVWIRIGEVLFYSFSVTAQEKGKRRWDGRVQTGWRWKPLLARALFHSVITGVFKVPRLMLPSLAST